MREAVVASSKQPGVDDPRDVAIVELLDFRDLEVALNEVLPNRASELIFATGPKVISPGKNAAPAASSAASQASSDPPLCSCALHAVYRSLALASVPPPVGRGAISGRMRDQVQRLRVAVEEIEPIPPRAFD